MNQLEDPLVSIVIPAYHSSATIGGTLRALRLQTYSRFELIVVNSSPDLETGQRVKEGFPEATFIQKPQRLLPHAARNIGAEKAIGNLLVFTDPDCLAERDWLEKMVDAHRTGLKAIVGSMGLAGGGWRATGIHLCKFHWLLPGLPASNKRCAPTANAAYSRDIWETIGPFPGSVYAGDGVLSRKAAAVGHEPRFVPEAMVRHHHSESLMSFLKQRVERGRDYARVRVTVLEEKSLQDRLSMLFSFLALPLVLFRSWKNSFRCGWSREWWVTLPVQAAGHLGWALGESMETAGMLLRGVTKGGKQI